MGFFQRLGSLIKSNLNDLISKAEDPEKMLNQVLVDMKSQLVEAKKQVAVAIGDEKRLKKQLDDEKARSEEWEKKAMLAVRAGDDGLAREALTRQKEHDDLAAQYEQQWHLQAQSVEKLKEQLRTLNNKIEEAKRKKNILVARAKRAEAQKTIQQTMAGISDTSAFDTFDRMAERVDALEAEAEATAELAGETSGDDLNRRFKALEAKGSGNDLALAELKAKMGLGPATDGGTKALPATSEGGGDKAALPAKGHEAKGE
jgi:phage shock protein A